MAQPANTVAALNLSTPFSVAGSPAAVYSFHQRMIETCWPKVATMQNRPAAANRIEKTPNASVSSTRAASMISVKFATMIEHLMMKTPAMPRTAGFFASPVSRPWSPDARAARLFSSDIRNVFPEEILHRLGAVIDLRHDISWHGEGFRVVAELRFLDAELRFVAGVPEPHVESAETLGESALDHLVDEL